MAFNTMVLTPNLLLLFSFVRTGLAQAYGAYNTPAQPAYPSAPRLASPAGYGTTAAPIGYVNTATTAAPIGYVNTATTAPPVGYGTTAAPYATTIGYATTTMGYGTPSTPPVMLISCREFQCPEGLQLKSNAASLHCAGDQCELSDAATCCERAGGAASPCATVAPPMKTLPNYASTTQAYTPAPVPDTYAPSTTTTTMIPSDCNGWEEEWRECDLAACQKCVPAQCVFGDWSDWSPMGGCTGLCVRDRMYQQAQSSCALPCEGVRSETKQGCQSSSKNCVASSDCKKGAWTEWDTSQCAYNPHAVKTSRRAIVHQAYGSGTACVGPTNRSKSCSHPYGQTDCMFTEWTDWSKCSASCGGGHHARTRSVNTYSDNGGKACAGSTNEENECNTQACEKDVDCVLELWSAWTGCDAANPMQQRRNRIIAREVSGNGIPCKGITTEISDCPKGSGDPCVFSPWAMWHGCTCSCGGGQKFRCRHILKGGTRGRRCNSTDLVETSPCALKPCHAGYHSGPVCEFAPWDTWSACSNLCSDGIQTRNRKVAGPFSEKNGCMGPLREIKPCKGTDTNCHSFIPCKWGDWSPWGGCTTTCGRGNKRRYRGIAIMPQGGGTLCPAYYKSEVTQCNTASCNALCIDGTWTPWGAWSACQASRCQQGFRTRHRIEATHANDCGTPAIGETEEYEKCFGEGLDPNGNVVNGTQHPCLRDCILSPWNAWGECSQTCYGLMQRNRRVEVMGFGGGAPCLGPLREEAACNPGPGQVAPNQCGGSWKIRNCVMTDWTPWTNCTASCGTGHHRRQRRVKVGPGPAGKVCQEPLSQIHVCNTMRCPGVACIDCQYGAWGAWSDCTVSGDTKYRRRYVIQMPNHCGKQCAATKTTEIHQCNSGGHATVYCTWASWDDWSKCAGDCGPERVMRSRHLHSTKVLPTGADPNNSANWLAMDRRHGHVAYCQGMQSDQKPCAPFRPCNVTCLRKECIFNDWTEWGEGNCQGLCNRFRTVQQHAKCGGTPCRGMLSETKVCPAVCDRPQNCKLGTWELWGNCMGSHSQTFRHRPILLMPHNGGHAQQCETTLSQTKWCKQPIPPTNCRLTDWSMWDKCTRPCGTGWTIRKRHIATPSMSGGTPCSGCVREYHPCNAKPCPHNQVDCLWEQWTAWCLCDANSQQSRKRSIKQQATETGKPCRGAAEEIRPCPAEACKITDWAAWSPCSAPCGGGERSRSRVIQTRARNGGDPCRMPIPTQEMQGCNLDGCHVSQDCKVSVWTSWSMCSATCGYGEQSRSRHVEKIRQQFGQGCMDMTNEVRGCMPKPCYGSKHCHYQPWTTWSPCSLSCGGGEKNRSRGFLTTGQPGGAGCHAGEAMAEVASCNVNKCAEGCMDAQWGSWSDWEACQVTCGGAMTWRHRVVESAANHCGKTGSDKQVKVCGNAKCYGDQDCEFSDWGAWGACSASCDGLMYITRRIKTPKLGKGNACVGPTKVYAPCNPVKGEVPPEGCAGGTPVDCQWATWSVGSCSEKCGGGVQVLNRSIAVPAKHMGRACEGDVAKIVTCNAQHCNNGADCQWGQWHEWGACDRCGGQRKRFRHIEMAAYAGAQCQQDDFEQVQSCSRKCHDGHYCVWGPWMPWGTCSATCGKGRQSRRRELVASANEPAVPIPDEAYVGQKFEALEALQKDIESRRQAHLKDVAVAFAAGCAAFFVLGAIARVFAMRSRIAGYECVSSEAVE